MIRTHTNTLMQTPVLQPFWCFHCRRVLLQVKDRTVVDTAAVLPV